MNCPVGESPAAAPLRVLVVDDERVQREGLVLIARELGYECVSAADGDEALEEHGRARADVIVADWNMHRMSGIELCARVRQDKGPYTYFILTTAMGDRPHFLAAMRAGADDFIAKPIDVEELEARLTSGARVIAMRRELAERNAELRRDSQRAFQSARVDPVTGIGNRLAMDEDLAKLHKYDRRYSRRYCLAMCDLDHFKEYNDRLGHLAGDEALRTCAHGIEEALRTGDSLYRFGGDEFVVILPEQTKEAATVAMDRARACVEAFGLHAASMGGGPPLTMSIGLVSGLECESAGVALSLADAALYRAKSEGRNRIVVSAERPMSDDSARIEATCK